MLERLSGSSPILSLSSKPCIHGAWTSPINTCQGSCQELTHQVYQRQQEHMVLPTSVVAPWFIKSNTESAAAHSNARVGGWEGKNKAWIIKSYGRGYSVAFPKLHKTPALRAIAPNWIVRSCWLQACGGGSSGLSACPHTPLERKYEQGEWTLLCFNWTIPPQESSCQAPFSSQI